MQSKSKKRIMKGKEHKRAGKHANNKARLATGRHLKKHAAKKSSHRSPSRTREKYNAFLGKQREEASRREEMLSNISKISNSVENKMLLKYISTNVGSRSGDILRALIKEPKTDDDIANILSVKVNDVRRMLNVMNGYSIVKYEVNKDSKGWLVFKWRIDRERLEDFVGELEKVPLQEDRQLPSECNDFFICKKCYPEQKTVLPFDSAYESDFSCGSCGKPYAMLNKEETIALFNETVTED